MTDQPEHSVFLASIALEPNRWKSKEDRRASLRISEWSLAAHNAGFAGWELWEDHFFLADPAEQAELECLSLPIRIFNTYVLPGVSPWAQLARVAEVVKALGDTVNGLKFNLGKADDAPLDRQIGAAMEWAEILPDSVRLLCECHPGTLLESPNVAAKAFQVWPKDRFGAIHHPMHKEVRNLETWFDALGDRIVHLHWQARTEDHSVCLLREVQEKFESRLSLLLEKGFRGTHSVEFVKGLGASDESVEGLFDSASDDVRTLSQAIAGLT